MIEVLKQALEALEKSQSALAEELSAWDIDPPLHHVQESHDLCGPAITSLRQAIAELESQEPVAWLRTSGIGSPVVTNEMFNAYPEMRLNFQTPLYAHPPQRTWVGLTDEEITSVANNSHPLNGVRSFARAIEAKLKQKNGFAEEKNT